MSTRRPMVAGNWKLNGTRDSSRALASAVAEGFGGVGASAMGRVDCVVCPVAVHLDIVRDALGHAPVALGAQDVAAQESGAFTGEIAATMLAESGCTHVIVGHSERRALFGETSEQVATKALAARAAGLTPILCVGETLEEREADRVEAVVGEQLDALLEAHGPDAFEHLIVAYEPVWAIGTGRTASPAEAQDVHRTIRERVAAKDAARAAALVVLYGGSVKPDNAAELFGQPDIDGGLIGGAALDAGSFLAICRAAADSTA